MRPSSHTGTRPWSPSARGIVVTLFLLFGAALVPPAANADIVYTFHCDIECNDLEGDEELTGSVTVRSTAQSAGQILFSDVTGFQFVFVEQYTLSLSDLSATFSTFPLPISTTTAEPTGTPPTGFIAFNFTHDVELRLTFQTGWNSPGGQPFVVGFTTEPQDVGLGHWSISMTPGPTPVPEPTSLALLGLGLVSLIGCLHNPAGRRRRDEGRSRAALSCSLQR